jgi:hypothetical protein
MRTQNLLDPLLIRVKTLSGRENSLGRRAQGVDIPSKTRELNARLNNESTQSQKKIANLTTVHAIVLIQMAARIRPQNPIFSLRRSPTKTQSRIHPMATKIPILSLLILEVSIQIVAMEVETTR